MPISVLRWYFNPVKGAERFKARAFMAFSGAYIGAALNRRATKAWFTTNNSADGDILPDLPTLRSRSRDLVRNALRMRPDRIILGECRGEEAFDMLQAMNTGHEGSMATIHANTPRDAISRLEQMIGMAGLPMTVASIRGQIAGAIQLIVQLQRQSDGKRRVIRN